jgi:hypothetical protein
MSQQSLVISIVAGRQMVPGVRRGVLMRAPMIGVPQSIISQELQYRLRERVRVLGRHEPTHIRQAAILSQMQSQSTGLPKLSA